jgi:hypothetical protein
MTADQIIDLLTAVSAYDNRKPNPAAVLAWGKAAELGRWTLPEALDAVHAHFSEDPAYLMPAHVTVRVKAARQDRAMREEALALTAAPENPAVASRVQEIVGALANRMGWEDSDRPRSGFALQVRCPHCGASEGVRCTQPSTGAALKQSSAHPARTEALAARLRGAAS